MEECKAAAAYRYTWPGRDEALICEEHAAKLRAVADAMGLHMQIIPVEDGECQQQTGGR